jgi:hypothetical protein
MRLLFFAYCPLSIGLAALVWSCGPIPISDLPPTGELGNGAFTYECPPGNVDVGCGQTSQPDASTSFDNDGPDAGTTAIPKVIAVGAAFTVTYTATNDGGVIQGDNGYPVTPASTRLATQSGDELIAQRPGYLALLAASLGTSSVDDFIFVRFAPIAYLTPALTVVSLPPGAIGTLSVTAQDQQMEALAGRLRCSWTSGDTSIVFNGPTSGASVQIEGIADGDATVKIACGPASTEVLVHVTPDVSDGGVEGGDSSPQGDAAQSDVFHADGALDGNAYKEGGDHD